jgi:MFS family permease
LKSPRFECDILQGFTAPLLGTTLVHLELLFNVDTATMAWTFTCHSLGFLSGAITCGVVYDRVNHELAFTVANMVEALATIIAPFTGSLYPFIAVLMFQSLAQGFIDAGKPERVH